MKYLIVALGNIGAEYIDTRHNVGFNIADVIAERQGVSFKLERFAFYTQYKYKGRQVHLIKPTTYMNLSGKALLHWMRDLKVPIERILVIVDDLVLPFGTIRLKPRGSSAGHNGLENIQYVLGTTIYPRLRFGIGDNFSKGKQVEYVLGKWNSQEKEELPSYVDAAVKAVDDFIFLGIVRAMNFNN